MDGEAERTLVREHAESLKFSGNKSKKTKSIKVLTRVFFDLGLKTRDEAAERTLVREHAERPKFSGNKSKKTKNIVAG